MPITGWINFTKEDHLTVKNILSLLQESGSVDELGVGSIRDAIADTLFPGFSTIQTRPKYFFIVHYILMEYIIDGSRKKNETAADYVKKVEKKVMRKLNSELDYGDGDGVIGITKTGQNDELARYPSEIYWNGLRTFSFVNTQHSRSVYLSKLNFTLINTLEKSKTKYNDEDKDDMGYAFSNYGLSKGTYYKEWYQELSMELDTVEASNIKDKLASLTGTFLAELFHYPEMANDFFEKTDNFHDASTLVLTNHSYQLSNFIQQQLTTAVNFSKLLEGANWAFNYLIRINKGGNAEQMKQNFNNYVKTFKQELVGNGINMTDIERIAPRIKPQTQLFLKKYIDEIMSEKPSFQKICEMVQQQERNLKGKRAKISGTSNVHLDEEIEYGLSSLSYRYNTVKNTYLDIKNALENPSQNA